MTVALLDGDIIVYQAAAASQKDVDWGDGLDGLTIDVSASIDTARRTVAHWTELARAHEPVLCFSPRDGSNFRKRIFPRYKAGRSDKPEAYWKTVDALEAEFRFYRIGGLEADDVMGILGTSDRFADAVIVSTDKDMKTVPATIFNPNKDQAPRRRRALQADHFWLTQTLTGDTTDGYPGCRGIGAVKAEAILAQGFPNFGSMWAAVVDAYVAKGFTEADAVLQARCARILRRTDYDKERNEITLWHPRAPETLSLASVTMASLDPASSASTPAEISPASPRSPSSSSTSSATASPSSPIPSSRCSEPSSEASASPSRRSSATSRVTSRKR